MDNAKSVGRPGNQGQPASDVWVALPGGELEGKRPKRVCGRCQSHPGTLCFDCYRAEFTREQRLKRAAAVDTGSEERLQHLLPLEPVHFGRLDVLKGERERQRVEERARAPFAVRRRQAQIHARAILQGARAGHSPFADRARAVAAAIEAAELQLPEAWLPFVVAR